MKRPILIFALVCLSLPAFSRTFYIDYVGGSNANNGTSNVTPWQCMPDPFMWYGTGTTCGTSPTYTWQAGDTFVLKGGVTWPSTTMPGCIATTKEITITNDPTYFTSQTVTGTVDTADIGGVHYINAGQWAQPSNGTDPDPYSGGYPILAAWAGTSITVNGVSKTVSAVQSVWSATLTTSAGTQTKVTFSHVGFSLPIIDLELSTAIEARSQTCVGGTGSRNLDAAFITTLSAGKAATINGLEIKNLKRSTTTGKGVFIHAGVTTSGSIVNVTNNYLHGWTVDPVAWPCDTAFGGFDVFTQKPSYTQMTVTGNKIQNEDYALVSPVGSKGIAGVGGGGSFNSNYVGRVASMLSPSNFSEYGYNLIRDINNPPDYQAAVGCGTSFHTNDFYILDTTTMHHNWVIGDHNASNSIVFTHPGWHSDGVGNFVGHDNVMFISLGETGATSTAFSCFGPDPTACGLAGQPCNISLYNNICVDQTNSHIFAVLSQQPSEPGTSLVNVDIRNNHMVSDLGAVDPVCYSGTTHPATGCVVASSVPITGTVTYTDLSSSENVALGNNLRQTVADATANGFTFSTLYQPQSAGAKTVGAGANLTAVCAGCATDILGVTRTVPWDIGPYQFVAAAANYTVTAACSGGANGTIVGSAGSVMNATCTAGVCSGTCSESITAGSSGTYTATATTGSLVSFTGGTCSGSPCTQVVNAPITLTALFQLTPTCTFTCVSNNINSPATVSCTAALTGLSSNYLWELTEPINGTAIAACNTDGCKTGATGNLQYTGSGIYTLSAIANGVLCTASTQPLNINTGAGSAAH